MKKYLFVLIFGFFLSCESSTSRLYGTWESEQKIKEKTGNFATEGIIETELTLEREGIYKSSITLNVQLRDLNQSVIFPQLQLKSTGHWKYSNRKLHLDRLSDNLDLVFDKYTDKLSLSQPAKVIADRFFDNIRKDALEKKSIFQIMKFKKDEFVILGKGDKEISLRKKW